MEKIIKFLLILWVSSLAVLFTLGCDDDPLYVSAYGDTFTFDLNESGVPGASITVLEYPGLSTTTDENGSFAFHKLIPNKEATFVFDHPDYTLNQTGTFDVIAEQDLTRVAFQTPEHYMFNALVAIIGFSVEEDTCQIATTVTRVGVSQYDHLAHGEEGATVSISPSLDSSHGPVYFDSHTIPDASLTETSTDGGVVYTNVPTGTYILTAHKEGVQFEQVKIKCRAGYLVNAAPPHGLQALP